MQFWSVGWSILLPRNKRQTNNDKTAYITHSHTLEFLWVLFLCYFYGSFCLGWKIYNQMRTYPKLILEIHAYEKQWSWEFAYKNGKNRPMNWSFLIDQPVKLILTANDVIHSFMCLPSELSKMLFLVGIQPWISTANKLARWVRFLCRILRWWSFKMLATIKVVPWRLWKWLQENDDALPIDQRGKTFRTGRVVSAVIDRWFSKKLDQL